MKNRIRLLVTSDIQGQIGAQSDLDQSNLDAGLAKCSSLISALKDEDTLLIDNGGALSGSALTYYHGRSHSDSMSPITQVMNAMNYDFINLGAADFAAGEKTLAKHLKELNAPCITSNVTYRDDPMGATYAIHEAAGKKIAVFAVTNSMIHHLVDKEAIRHCTFSNAVTAAKKSVSLMKDLEKPDFIIGLYQGGLEQDPETGVSLIGNKGEQEALRMLQEIAGIDVLITAGQNRSLSTKVRETTVVQIKPHGQEIACIDIYIDNKTTEVQLFQADGEADDSILSLIDIENQECNAWLDTTVGTTVQDLSTDPSTYLRYMKPEVVTLMNDAVLAASDADIAFTTLPAGVKGLRNSITVRDLFSLYQDFSTISVRKMNGKQLKAYLEKCAAYWTITVGRPAVTARYNTPDGVAAYDMANGIDYTIDLQNSVGERITSVLYKNSPISEDQEFNVAIRAHRSQGNDDYSECMNLPAVSKLHQNGFELLLAYVQKESPVRVDTNDNIHIGF